MTTTEEKKIDKATEQKCLQTGHRWRFNQPELDMRIPKGDFQQIMRLWKIGQEHVALGGPHAMDTCFKRVGMYQAAGMPVDYCEVCAVRDFLLAVGVDITFPVAPKRKC